MQNQDFRHKSAQNGNALWLILIAIAMLVTLTLFITRTSEKTADNMSAEQARVIATQLHRDLNTFESAVQKLMLSNSCSEMEINFDNTVKVGYANGNAPASKKCDVFQPEGAGLNYQAMPIAAMASDATVASKAGWDFLATLSVNGVGPESATETICASNCGDLIAVQQYIAPAVCSQYNLIVNIAGGTIPVTASATLLTGLFTGTYGAGTLAVRRISTGAGDATTSTYAAKTACMQISGTSPARYFIYKVLIAR